MKHGNIQARWETGEECNLERITEAAYTLDANFNILQACKLSFWKWRGGYLTAFSPPGRQANNPGLWRRFKDRSLKLESMCSPQTFLWSLAKSLKVSIATMI